MIANPTEAEAALWTRLKGKQLEVKIRQQHLIEDYIVDFACLSRKLVIEVDGEIHNNQKEQDEARTKVLEEKGYKVIRFTNNEVIANIDEVINEIKSQIAVRKIVSKEENEEVLPLGKDLGWEYIEVFTTRPDTIFGVNFMVLAPEHELVAKITTDEFKAEVEAYQLKSKGKSERDRQANVKEISGQNTGAFAIHPFTGEKVQIWIGDYVLASYGTGAVMSVPAGDQRDWDFANHFGIEIKNIFGDTNISEGAYEGKDAELINSDFLNGLKAKKAIGAAIKAIQEKAIGKCKTQFRLRDAIFSRQRYWGEPFPVYYKDGLPYLIEDEHLPIVLPEVEKYLPTEDGAPPLGNAEKWFWNEKENKITEKPTEVVLLGENEENNKKILPLGEDLGGDIELNTMPGWAGSSWYFLRYMDPTNENEFVSKEKADYWNQVDLYIGGAEHATGHLLYSRFWCKFLFDKGLISFNEPFKKMINQGMILGRSSFVYKTSVSFGIESDNKETTELEDEFLKLNEKPIFVSENFKNLHLHNDKLFVEKVNEFKTEFFKGKDNQIKVISFDISKSYQSLPVDINIVDNDVLDIDAFKNWREEHATAEFITEENGDYICGHEIEKMSKSKFNVQTPDDLVVKYGADTLRCYEMFLGPLEQAKPWDTKGISGVSNFLKKLWRLFHQNETFTITEGDPDKKALKSLHTIIKKASGDLERYSFNTIVSSLMIAVNEFTEQKCNNKEVLSQLLIIASPYAPHITEELWSKLGNKNSISTEAWPVFNPKFLEEDAYAYPISFNGKMRFKLELPTNLSKEEIEKEVLAAAQSQKYLDGKAPKKVIVVPKKIVNIVI
jgi:leucyl-tRNA synthetase